MIIYLIVILLVFLNSSWSHLFILFAEIMESDIELARRIQAQFDSEGSNAGLPS